uniref:TRASH domain-containing protein n=1 Tax=Heterorhabditis bacteriophora TaxID=37862 RepID=A0A1I7XI90_HETBA
MQVPVCPMCDQPVPTPKGVSSDFQVNEHIMNNCTIAKKKKVFSNRCSQKGCKKRKVAAVARNQGRQNCASQVRSTILEDEAMAHALAASLNNTHINPEEIDRRLAEQLQQEEYQ